MLYGAGTGIDRPLPPGGAPRCRHAAVWQPGAVVGRRLRAARHQWRQPVGQWRARRRQWRPPLSRSTAFRSALGPSGLPALPRNEEAGAARRGRTGSRLTELKAGCRSSHA